MSNMSYCRFRNTLLDLQDCEDHFLDENLNDDELQASKDLYELCKSIVLQYEGDFDDEDYEKESEERPEYTPSYERNTTILETISQFHPILSAWQKKCRCHFFKLCK